MASEIFEMQVALLVRVLPYVATENCFALKGGTAINLFIRDLPRLSVDIDLVYLPIEDRETSLIGIRSALSRITPEDS
jgi:predicted nucleotidyltransferase component of viral defense system